MSSWDSVADNVEFNLEIALDEFLSQVEPSEKILDFGCGYGRISDQLCRAGYSNIVAVDSSNEMINRGLRELPHLDLRFIAEGALPFRDGEFDCVVACAVFTCIPDATIRAFVVSELHRVLKPNGVIHLAEFCSEQGISFTSGFGVPMWHGRPSEIEAMLSEFCVLSANVVETETMAGSPNQACHIYATKVI